MEGINSAKNWLLNSGIQNLEGEHKGAFNSWFDVNNKNYPYAYSEITGYAITTLLFLYKLEKKEIYLKRAKLAANWLINKATHKSGGILCRYFYDKTEFRGSFENEEMFLFDSGMVLNGIINLYEITKDEKYKNFAIKICDYSLKFFQNDGRVITFSKTGDSLFHPHCYAAEGLYVAGKYLNNKKYLEFSKKATEYLFNNQKENGGIPQFFKDNKLIDLERSDILAQSLRLGALHSINKEKLDKLARRLLEFQNLNEEQKGGFKYGYDDNGNKYEH